MSPAASRSRRAEGGSGGPGRAAPGGALEAFARGELPWGERPEPAPAGRGIRVIAIDCRSGRADAAARGGDDVGHGKAIAALIRRVAPAAEVLAVKILDRGSTTSVDVLRGALQFAQRSRARVVNLSVAVAAKDRARVAALCREALRNGIVVVASARSGAGRAGSLAVLPEVIGVAGDARLGERSLRYARGAAVECRTSGSGPAPERTRGRGLAADAFAAARVSGAVACILEARPRADLAAVRDELEAHFAARPGARPRPRP